MWQTNEPPDTEREQDALPGLLCAHEEHQGGKMMDREDIALERVRRFFKEHPVHGFGCRTVAGYLNMDESDVSTAMRRLAAAGFLKETYQMSPAALDELMSECRHERLRPWHDNSVLCIDCREIIWQDLNGNPAPAELKARFVEG
jgi:hypothetical protein